MKPPYTRAGLDAFLAAVPLPIPLPPGPHESWSCLLSLLGPAVALGRSGHEPKAGDALLAALLEAAGRPAPEDECRALRLATPIPADRDGLALLVTALQGPASAEAARALGWLGDVRAVPWLERTVSHQDAYLRRESLIALGRLGVADARLGPWDGEVDEARLLARVALGQSVSPLPEALEGLQGFFSGEPDVEALQEAIERDGDVVAAVLAQFRAHPELAIDLGEWLGEQLVRVCEQPAWAAVIAMAGEEVLDTLREAVSSEDWRVRLGAAITLGHFDDPRALELLRPMQGDDDGDVRREASLALYARDPSIQIGDWTSGYDFIGRAAHHPVGAALAGDEVQLSILSVLTSRMDAIVSASVTLMLALAHPDAMGPALEALALDDSCELAVEIRQAAAAGLLLTAHPPKERAVVIRVLLRGIGAPLPTGSLEGVAAEEVIAVVARDWDWNVRLSALGLLDRLGEAGRYDGLLAAMEATDSDNDVRARAASMRTPVFRPRGLGAGLADLVVSHRHAEGARGRGLVEVGRADRGLQHALAATLFHAFDRETALAAARVLGESTEAATLSDQIALGLRRLSSQDWLGREVAAALLGSIPATLLPADTKEELVETLEGVVSDDADQDVQRMARWAAERLS